jgi:putative ABC transport system permease protein
VGATEWDVQLQFLGEAVALSLLGGALGLLAGVLSSAVVEDFFKFPTKLTPEVLAIGAVFAATLGILFGFYPARKASQLDPIQCLRYE